MKRNKYGAVKATIDGITFDSKAEENRYCELRYLKLGGQIKDFELQPEFELQPAFKKNGQVIKAIKYRADFKIINNDGTIEIEDVKGMQAKEFRIKRKLFEFRYPDLTLKIV